MQGIVGRITPDIWLWANVAGQEIEFTGATWRTNASSGIANQRVCSESHTKDHGISTHYRDLYRAACILPLVEISPPWRIRLIETANMPIAMIELVGLAGHQNFNLYTIPCLSSTRCNYGSQLLLAVACPEKEQ